MKKWLKNMKKDQRGLTLVELLAVVVILAIVAAIAFVLIGNVIDNSRKDAHISNAKQLISSAKLYEANGGTVDTKGVQSTVLQDNDFLGPLINPWTKETYTGTVYKSDDGVYSVSLNAENQCNIDNKTEEYLNTNKRDTICP